MRTCQNLITSTNSILSINIIDVKVINVHQDGTATEDHQIKMFLLLDRHKYRFGVSILKKLSQYKEKIKPNKE